MRLINSYTLEFREFENGSCPPYAILSHTWGGEEVLYRDMLWIQDYRRTHESGVPPANEDGKAKDGGTADDLSAGGSGSRLPARTLPDGDEECPPYEEVEESSTEDQAAARALRGRHGYQKILKIAEHCRVSQIGFFWIDTCCIDKANGLEVSEAVLAAHRWYREATVCFVYLADVPAIDVLADRDSVFRRSWWFTRGWTLVELLAPTARVWFDQEWNFIFPDPRLIHEITGIDAGYLEGANINLTCIAKRMSWAAHRNTTKEEDAAYCLMGLFDVSMPVLYGEGAEKAFLRLQRKILKTTVDTSIFAWGYDAPILTDSWRLLATSPDEFAGCRTLRRAQVQQMNDHFLLGGRGLEFRSDIALFRARDARVWESQYGVLMSEIFDDMAPDHRILLPVGSLGATPGAFEEGRVVLRRFPGSRPIRVAAKARTRLNATPRRSFHFRNDDQGLNPLLTVLFTPSLATLPFKLVEVFPAYALMPSAGGFVAPRAMTPTSPNLVFLRYEEQAAGPASPLRRRFVVVLEYTGGRETGGAFAMKSASVHVLNVTNSHLVSFCDEFISQPDKAKPNNWTRYLSSVPVGDTLVAARVDVDSERWDRMRLRVQTAPLGSVGDGIMSGDMLAAKARPEGERLRTPFD